MFNKFDLRSLSHRMIGRVLLVSSVSVLAACGGEPDDKPNSSKPSANSTSSSNSSKSNTPNNSTVSSSSSSIKAFPVGPFTPPEASLRRLTPSEYQNSVVDILDINPDGIEELGTDKSLSLGGFVSIGARRLGMSPSEVEKLEKISYEIAKKAIVDSASRASLVGCQPARANDSCVQGFVKKYSRLFYRRPATNAETARITKVIDTVTNLSDIWTGLSYGLSSMLQSPNFLYRAELGEAQENSEWLRYTGFERATRLAFLLTGSSPDEALLDAAESGALDTPQGLLQHAERLSKSPRFEDTLSHFFSEQLHLNSIGSMVKAPTHKLTPTLASAMQKEVELIIRDWIWNQKRPISELMLSEETFVNRELAEFYGLPAPQGQKFVPQNRDSGGARVGLLGAAGILAVHSGFTETSATMRGRYIVQQLLCLDIPEPPPGTDVTLQPLPEGVVLTLRERVALHLTAPACQGCHLAMDPIGLPLEHFDAVGKYREKDHGLEIDVSGNLPLPHSSSFDGLRGLATALADDPRVDACMVKKFYSYALGHELSKKDNRAVADLQATYSGDFTNLVKSLVQHESFFLASGTAPPAPAPMSPTIEAEDFDSASPSAPFVAQQDGGRTIVVWPGEGEANVNPTDNTEGQLFYTLTASETSLTLYATVNFSNADNDSFHYKLDGVSNWTMLNSVGTAGYEEIEVGSWNNLTVGQSYTLKIQRREDGAKFDSFRAQGGDFNQ